MVATELLKLNVGCGRRNDPGWIGLDSVSLPGVDVLFDLEKCSTDRIPLEDDSVGEFLLSHLIEHVKSPLPMMQELHRIAAPGAIMNARCPYGSSDDAFEDPTHVRQYFLNSWLYFSQPAYWRADYGYRGDWQAEKVVLMVGDDFRNHKPREILKCVNRDRNVVREMIAQLRAVKPIREPDANLQRAPELQFCIIS